MTEPRGVAAPYSPDVPELLRAVREFLDQAAGELEGPSRFLAKSSVYVLGICERELRDGAGYAREEQALLARFVGHEGTPADLRGRLASQIRAGAHDARWDELIGELLAATINEVRLVKADHMATEHRGPNLPPKT